MDKLKLVKTAVFILTFLLVLGTLLLLTKIVQDTRNANKPMPVATSLNQPYGSEIAQMIEKNGTLYLLVKDGGLPDRILVVTPNNLNSISTINLH